MDPRARSRPRHSVEGQLFVLARTEGRAPAAGRIRRKGAPEGDPARTRMGAPGREGPPVEGQGAPEPLRGAELGRVPAAQRDQRNLHSARRAPRRSRRRVQERFEIVRRSDADRRSELQGSARRDRRHHRPERRRQIDVLQADHRRRKAGQRRDRDGPDREARVTSTSPASHSTARRPSGRKFPAAPTSSRSASTRRRRAATSAASTSRAPISRRSSASSPAASAGACTWPRR